jgi:uncharacterized protein YaiI (UPF0178 family)
MRIWVDADACPGPMKEILFRAAERRCLPLVLVANQAVRVPPSQYVAAVQVPKGFDVADNHIVQSLEPGDLVITADIPLAAEALAKGAHAINPRGERYSNDTIRERLVMRDFMEIMRGTGQVTGGPSPLSQADRQAFANALDRFLTQLRS